MTVVAKSLREELALSNARLPHKAVPSKKGHVAYFEEHCEQPFSWGLLVEIPRELTSTDIAMKQAMYPSAPSVLVLGEDVRFHEGSMKRRGMEAKAVPEVYGDLNSPHSSVWYNNPNFSLNDFLRSLWVMEPTGSYYLQIPESVDTEVALRVLNLSRDLFDVVLTTNRRIYEADKTQVKWYWMFCNVFFYGRSKERPKKKPEGCTTILHSDQTDLLNSFESDLKILWTKKRKPEEVNDNISRLLMQILALDILGSRPEQMPEFKQGWVMRKLKTYNKAMYGWTLPGAFVTPPITWAVSELTSLGLPPDFLITSSLLGLLGGFAGFMTFVYDVLRKTDADIEKFKKSHPLPDFEYPVLVLESSQRPPLLEEASQECLGEMLDESAGEPSAAFLMPAQVVAKRHEKVLSSWLSYETEPVRLLEAPLLSDPSCPQTQDFYRAMRRAEEWAEVVRQDGGYQDKYAAAVEALEDAFEIAEKHAKKMGLSQFNNHQRKQVKKASQLVQIAQDEAAAPTERKNAWRKATQALEGVMALPDTAVIGLLES